jgi:dihydroorotase
MTDPLARRPAPAANLLVRGAHVVDPRAELDGPGDVLVRDGEIAALGEAGTLEAPAGVEIVEAGGRHLTPAFVDPHVHLRSPGQEHKEDLDSGTRAAAAGGFCVVIAMPNTTPPIDAPPLLGAVRDAARRHARVPIGFLAAASRGLGSEEMTEMAALREAGALGFTDDGLPLASARMVRRALQYQRLCGGVLALHEEDTSLSGDGVMHEGAVSAQLGMAGIPSISESVAIARDAAIAGYEEGRIHALHVSCRESVEAVATAKEAGVRITAEACPHHLTHTDESVRTLGTHFKMNPPLRSADDREALVEGLRSGVIDCVATDHAPHAPEEKDVPWEQALNGTTGLETAFAALHTHLVGPGRFTLSLLVERMTAGAEVYDLPVPTIAREAPANLCLVDLDAEVTVGDDPYETRGEHCTYHGERVRGRVLLTVAAGSVAYRQRAFALSAA